jgi:RNA polymerase sigma-70 factor (ECF subfamily)
MKSDLELVEDVKLGDRKAFSELVLRHQRPLLRLTMRFLKDQMLAEDVVQESFIKAYEKINLFEGRSSFKSWLFQIAVNTAKNRLRSMPLEQVNIDDVHLGVDPGAESHMVRGDLTRILRAEVDLLPERQRMALNLRIFEDLSFKEIAEIMGCPYDTAKANYRHGLMRLKERLEELQGETDWKDFETFLPVEGRRIASEADQ